MKYYSAGETASFTRIIPHSLTFLIQSDNLSTQGIKAESEKV
jgi:hypothetical protein